MYSFIQSKTGLKVLSASFGIALPDNFINPFSVNINVYGNVGGTVSSTKYGIGLDSGTLKQILNPNFQPVGYVDFVVLVRYKGDVVPVTAITQSNS
jgi:hypothetical protein